MPTFTSDPTDRWLLTSAERTLAASAKSDVNRLGLALLLKYFLREWRFPKTKDAIPSVAVTLVSQELGLPAALWADYTWDGRTLKRHRAIIRRFLGLRKTSVAHGKQLKDWLTTEVVPYQRRYAAILAAALNRCRTLHLEPPTAGRLHRIVRSAIATLDTHTYTQAWNRLSPATRAYLDGLLLVFPQSVDADSPPLRRSGLSLLRRDAGAVSLASVLNELEKLARIEQLGLPDDLFQGVSSATLQRYRQRLAIEDVSAIRRHPDAIRATLLAAFCWLRRRDILDSLIDLILDVLHRMGARAERDVDTEVLQDIKRVRGKNQILYSVAEATMLDPDGIVREVVYPAAGGEQTLRDLVEEWHATGSYERRVQLKMRKSYSHHYRRMLPAILKALRFYSNNARYRPVIEALDLLQRCVDVPSTTISYPADEVVPLDGVVPKAWRSLVLQPSAKGKPQINRITYELCVLNALREKVRCKEIWVDGADHFRNPDEDLPPDFDQNRAQYYADLDLPLDVETFIAREQQLMQNALAHLDATIPTNPKVRLIQLREKGAIVVTPLSAQPEPPTLPHLKAAIRERWRWVSLLDMLKEADFRIGFTDLFQTSGHHEQLDRRVIQKRLLLALYALGTNTGMKRVSAGDHGENHRDLAYIAQRYITKDALRAAITEVVNAILRARHPHIWGEATTACASDSKKFGAWDQNLLTEWHVRYRGPGIMVYWHVEKQSVCIYSQVKRCSSSEVAAMIEGVLRHCTDMTVTKNYVDSHGQSEIAFAFCSLLGFDLLPRLKGINKQKLYRPESGMPDAYPQLQAVLTRPINWDLIRQHYDEMIKYTTALRLGTADAEALLRRFTRNGPQHPSYQALAEFGKARKTVFLCHYLASEALRQEIHDGLNTVEQWNSTNNFIFFAKGGEIATNNREGQEIAVLALHLLQISMAYINTLMLQEMLAEPAWVARMQAADWRALNPLFFGHVTPYGVFHLDMDRRLPLVA